MSFFISTYAGVEFGVFEEAYYFEDDSKYSDDICSLLEWEQKPSLFLGLNTEVNFNSFDIFADFSVKFPIKCGIMKDSDYWENGVNFNYSESENYVDKAFSVSTGIGYVFNLSKLFLEPKIIASYSYNSFKAKNGHGWYAGPSFSSDGQLHSWDSEYAHYFPDGKYHLAKVNYENQTFFFMTGFEISKKFFKKWDTAAGFYFAPFTYSYAKDHHLGKSNNFYTEDYIYNYFKNYVIEISNDFLINKHIAICSVVTGNLQLLTTGEDYLNGYVNNQKGGESYRSLKVILGTKFIF